MTSILVIDDNPADREQLAAQLRSTGDFSVEAYGSGADGLARLEENGIDCVLLDYRLDGANGLSVLASLKASEVLMPVILLSDERNDALAEKAMSAGASKYLSKKELTTSYLIESVQSAVMSRSVLRERGPTDIRTRHILLAEDNDDDRAWIKGMLCGANAAVSVTSVATGDEILEHVRRHGVDCVVLDYRLEAEDGLDILAKLKALSPFLPVIMLTGQGNEEVAAKCIRVGAAEYLIKQRLNETYLSAAIENAMSRAALEAKVAEQEEQRRRFLSTLVHDLRAPLRNVRRLGEFAVEEANSGDLIEMQELLSMQSSIAARATDLIEMLESYALLDGNVTFRTLSLTEAAEAAKANLAAIIAERQAEVVIGAMPDILGHAPQLMQMFQNLIGNGLKYNDSGSPRIDIKVEEQSVGMLTVVVRDNGIGVPHKHLKTIFSPLKRLWGQDTYEGSGLGLAICQKIVERHGGTIWCTSVEGQGSAFHIRLPSTD